MHVLRDRIFAIVALFIALLSYETNITTAQTPAAAARKTGTAMIAGRITIEGDKPAAGIIVTLTSVDYNARRKPFAKTTTDADGRYRLASLPAGRYSIYPLAPSYVLPGSQEFNEGGQFVTLVDGDEVKDFDLDLKRGGVITGRVVDGEGRPVMGAPVQLMTIDARGQKRPVQRLNWSTNVTDDRGVYRWFALPAGRYLVGVGSDEENMIGRGMYKRVYYPDDADESRAQIVEIAPGTVAENINLTVGAMTKAYNVTGRVIEAETGKPIPDLICAYGRMEKDNRRLSGSRTTNQRTNARGEFRLEGLPSGNYAAFVSADEGADIYSDPAPFEVRDADASGVEIKVHRGATVDGTIVLEGNNTDKTAAQKFPQIMLQTYSQPTESGSAPRMPNRVQIGADGSFHIGGLPPGKLRLFLDTWRGARGFTLARIERGGVEQRDGVAINAGDQINDLRLVVAYGTGRIRGQVKIINGTLPPNAAVGVWVQRAGTTAPDGRQGSGIDLRGRFVIENLTAGEYELNLNYFVPDSGPVRNRQPVKQSVIVNEGVDADVTLTLDLGGSPAAGQQEGEGNQTP